MVYITVLINIQLKSEFIVLMQLNTIHPLSAKTVEKIFSHYPRNQVADLKRMKLSEKKIRTTGIYFTTWEISVLWECL